MQICTSKYSQLLSFLDNRNSCWQPKLSGWIQATILGQVLMQQNIKSIFISCFRYLGKLRRVLSISWISLLKMCQLWVPKKIPITFLSTLIYTIKTCKTRSDQILKINLRMYFQFGPILKKTNQIILPHYFNWQGCQNPGGASPPPRFCQVGYITLSQPGSDYAHHIITPPPSGFADLPTALQSKVKG